MTSSECYSNIMSSSWCTRKGIRYTSPITLGDVVKCTQGDITYYSMTVSDTTQSHKWLILEKYDKNTKK